MDSTQLNFYVYVSIAGENKISILKMSPETAALTPHGEVTVYSPPSILTVHPTRDVLYAAIRATGDIMSFRVDRSTGQLELMDTRVTGLEDPAYLEIDKTGDFLIIPYYVPGKVAVYPIRDDGTLQSKPSDTHVTGEHAHGVAIDPSNRSVFVSHTCPTNSIFQFQFDPSVGILSPNAIPQVIPESEDGPRHICFHPSKSFVYADNEQGSSVTAYKFNASNGTLNAFQTLSTLPEDYDGGNSCARLEMHPSGKFLYAANRGHDSIAGYAISPDGSLTSTGYYPTEKTPRSFRIDPNGKFLISAGQSANRLISYRIDADAGYLYPLGTYDVGKEPWWVLIVKGVG